MSLVNGIPDWPRFEPRGGRHFAVPSSWAGSGGEFMGWSIGPVHDAGISRCPNGSRYPRNACVLSAVQIKKTYLSINCSLEIFFQNRV